MIALSLLILHLAWSLLTSNHTATHSLRPALHKAQHIMFMCSGVPCRPPCSPSQQPCRTASCPQSCSTWWTRQQAASPASRHQAAPFLILTAPPPPPPPRGTTPALPNPLFQPSQPISPPPAGPCDCSQQPGHGLFCADGRSSPAAVSAAYQRSAPHVPSSFRRLR